MHHSFRFWDKTHSLEIVIKEHLLNINFFQHSKPMAYKPNQWERPHAFIPIQHGKSKWTPWSQNTRYSHVKNAEEAQLNKVVLGVKGLTWFSYLPKLDTIRGTAIDYMHCILLGVVKMLATLWFEKSHKQELFNIASRITEVDQRLLNIKPPSYIPRSGRWVRYRISKLQSWRTFCCSTACPACLGYCQWTSIIISPYLCIQRTSFFKRRSPPQTFNDARGCC